MLNVCWGIRNKAILMNLRIKWFHSQPMLLSIKTIQHLESSNNHKKNKFKEIHTTRLRDQEHIPPKLFRTKKNYQNKNKNFTEF